MPILSAERLLANAIYKCYSVTCPKLIGTFRIAKGKLDFGRRTVLVGFDGPLEAQRYRGPVELHAQTIYRRRVLVNGTTHPHL